MQRKSITQSELVAALGGVDAAQRQAALKALFDNASLRKQAVAHVRSKGGSREDGEDAFQEAVIVLDRKIRLGDFRGEGSLEAYFMGIVRWHWFNERQKRNKAPTVSGDHIPEAPAGGNPELDYLLTERREQMESLLEKMSEKCRTILKMYQLDYSMEEIAQAAGYANAGVAKKEAFLCRQRFLLLLKKVPELWKDLAKPDKL